MFNRWCCWMFGFYPHWSLFLFQLWLLVLDLNCKNILHKLRVWTNIQPISRVISEQSSTCCIKWRHGELHFRKTDDHLSLKQMTGTNFGGQSVRFALILMILIWLFLTSYLMLKKGRVLPRLTEIWSPHCIHTRMKIPSSYSCSSSLFPSLVHQHLTWTLLEFSLYVKLG